jgi:Arc/MetJ-type ribon-helix-helix transcriptional regulator
MMPVMVKTMYSLRLDGKLLAEAQRLVDAGEFDSLADMVEKALRDYLQSFDAASSDDGPDARLRRILLDGAGAGSSAAHAAAAPPSQDGVPTTGSREPADGGPQARSAAEPTAGSSEPPGSGPQARSAGVRETGSLAPIDDALDARVLKGLTDAFSEQEREEYERLVTSYSLVAQRQFQEGGIRELAQHQLQDGEMRELAEIFQTYGLQDALNALHEAQNSKVPLSPSYLETMLARSQTTTESMGPKTIGTFRRMSDGPERVFADFDNPLAAEVAVLYEKEIGLLTERVRDQIRTYIVEFPDLQRWQEAFDAAAGMNKRSLRYVLGVLRGNATKVVEQKGKDKRGLSKSERVRTEKRKQSADYFKRWEDKRKARQKSDPSK